MRCGLHHTCSAHQQACTEGSCSLCHLLTQCIGDAADAIAEAVSVALHVGYLAHCIRLRARVPEMGFCRHYLQVRHICDLSAL